MVSLNPSDEYLYKIRPCVIQSFTAHYNSSGIPAFYKGGKGAPGSVDISVGLKEIELWTSDNYASANRITQGPDISTSNLGVGATR
jgi:hypothetical protein